MSLLSKIDALIAKVNAMSPTNPLGGFAAPASLTVPKGHTTDSWFGASAAALASSRADTPPSAEQKRPEPPAPEQKQVPKKQKQPKQKKAKQSKPKGKKGTADPNQPAFTRVEFRVGRIVDCKQHPDANKMYLESIDLGEGAPRQIVSGLVDYVPLDEMKNAMVIVVANLKPAKLRGILSYGMVLAASNSEHTVVELVRPPTGAQPGDRVYVQGNEDDLKTFEADKAVNPKKKNSPWHEVAAGLKTDTERRASFCGVPLVTHAGVCTVPSLVDCHIK